MTDPQIIAVVIGILGALIGVYFRESISRAKLKLSTAVTLESILFYWFNQGMQNKPLTDLLITGQLLGKKEKEAIRSGDITKIEEFRKNIESNMKEAKEAFLEDQKENIKTIITEIKKLSNEEYNEIISEITKYRESISDLNGFLGQDKLSVLDWHQLPSIVELKVEIQSIITDLKLGIIHIHTNEEPSSEKIGMLLFSMITSTLKASKNLIPLIEYSKSVRQKGLLGNIFS
jgi:hypothetical protein